MIDLTPLEVRQKKGDFRRAMRGYDPELVNDFLDLVADRMEELVKEAMTLRDRVATLEEDLDGFKNKERALSDALMTAQKLREDARSHAEREGELLVREARLAAETARDEATRQLAREEEALRQVRARRAQLVDSFRRLLEKEMRELAVIEEALDLRGAGSQPRRGGGEGRTRPRAPGRGPAGSQGSQGSPSAPGQAPAAGGGARTGKGGPPGPTEDTESRSAGDEVASGGATGGGAAAEERARRAAAETEAGAEERRKDGEVQEDWLSSLVEEE